MIPTKKSLKKSLNIVFFALRNPNRIPILARKIWLRFSEASLNETSSARKWAQDNLRDFKLVKEYVEPVFIKEFDFHFKSNSIYSSQQEFSVEKLELGGGGHLELLFYLVRTVKPNLVLETGVAAGFSSNAILRAINLNGAGTLYSSDLPYFRMENPEQYIGIMVPKELRSNWKLYLNGDLQNFKEILANKNLVFDLIHYDSDKRKKSRINFYNLIVKKISANAILIFDDIQDDLSFSEIVNQNNHKYVILEWEDKFVGCIFFGEVPPFLKPLL